MSNDPPSTPEAFDALLARAQRGDRQALERVLSVVAPSVYRFGMRMCRNVHDAEDVLQDTLIAMADHLRDFEGRSSLSSWVFVLARSACARRRRSRKDQPHADETELAQKADAGPTPEAQTADLELAHALSDALDTLSEDQREVILLRDVEGLTAPEAAAALEIGVDALKSRLHRAREALRTALQPLLEPRTNAAPSGCPDVVALWSKKLEGDLSQTDCSAMEKHLEGCRACGSACNALKKVLVACQHVRDEEVPPAIQLRVKNAVRDWMAANGR